MEDTPLFVSDGIPEAQAEEELQALTIEDFSIGDFASIGLTVGGSALLVSALVISVLSILRSR